MPTPMRLAALALVFNAMVWGLSWWPLRWLDTRGLHPLWTTALVYGACVLVVSVWKRGGVWLDMRHGSLWLIALGSGLTNACFNWAATTGDVVRVVLLFYLMPVWAVLLARLILGERFTLSSLLRVAMAMVGAAIVLGVSTDGLSLPRTLPDLLAIVGGAAFAFNNVMLRYASQRSESSRTLAMFFGGAVLASLAALALGPSGRVAPPQWATKQTAELQMAAALAAACLLSNMALQYGASRLTANATAVIMLTEVAFAAVSSWLLGAAELEPRVLTGGALILGAAALAAWSPATQPLER